jgi:hypothetical protein
MLSCGSPRSTVRMPSLEARIGPIVAEVSKSVQHRDTALLVYEEGEVLTATGRVIAHDKLLHGNAMLLGNQAQEVRGERRGGVALIGVVLQHGTALHAWCVIALVLRGVLCKGAGTERISHWGDADQCDA